MAKQAGRVRDLADQLPKRFAGKLGIGHTRWATHGPANDVNAHPHVDTKGDVAVVHNGIIDNAAALRAGLADAGVDLVSDTDTEVLAHLIARSEAETLEGKVVEALARVEGTYGLAVLHAAYPDRIVVARNGSPADHRGRRPRDVRRLRPGRAGPLHDAGRAPRRRRAGHDHRRAASRRTARTSARWPGRRPRSTSTRRRTTRASTSRSCTRRCSSSRRPPSGCCAVGSTSGSAPSHLGGLEMDARELRAIRRVKVLGCGSAYYVGQMGAGLVEELARIPADAEAASEFRYRNPIIEPDTLYVAVSQSGETIDTLLAVQEIRRKGGRVVGLVNVVGSAIARECDGGIYLHAGPEVAVASTKALTNMFLGFALLALQLGRVRDLSIADGRRLVAGLQRLPEQIGEVLAQEPALAELAGRLAEAESLFFIGRVRGYPVAREGAQKFKEISYRHAEAYQTSELKHGPLALIAPTVPTVAVVPDDELTERNVGALHEVAARGGPLVVVTHAAVDLGDLAVPGVGGPDRRTPQRARARPDPDDDRRSSCWPTTPRSRSGTTSTSRATWPSRSRSSDGFAAVGNPAPPASGLAS